MPDKLLSIVFSFRNEEDVLSELIARCRKVIATEKSRRTISDGEMVFVNDFSTDKSLEVLLEAAKGHRDIKIVNMSRNFGLGPSVMAGLAHSKGDLLVYMDSDLQDPPELIGEMIAQMTAQGADVVHTVRRSRKGETGFKLFVIQIAYWILNRFSTVMIPKQAGDFKLLSRRAVNHLLSFKEIKPFMRGLVVWIGFKQIFVPYDREARFKGKTKFLILGMKSISYFLDCALINFSAVPLQLASFCGLSAILIDVIVCIHALREKIIGEAVPGWTALMIVVLFIGGVQLFCIGVIGLYLNSVHEQGKNRPLYIVDSTYGFDTDPN